ncbi:unnamed protein product [Linum tenue]|uniref:Uncharacterized protein n=1 Tax=Linum tenue TaxID=586396 RepID=A0AAV0KJ30_9ROSI|nr:unnamed protein product [Linum tenue]
MYFVILIRGKFTFRIPSIVDRNEESSGTGDLDDDAIEIRSSLSHWLLFPA